MLYEVITGSGAHGPRHAVGRRGRLAGPSRRADRAPALRQRQLAGRRPDRVAGSASRRRRPVAAMAGDSIFSGVRQDRAAIAQLDRATDYRNNFV